MFVWSPQWLQTFKKVRILAKDTYDASATPTANTRRRVTLGELNLDVLRKSVEQLVKDAEDVDPRALKKKLVNLQSSFDRVCKEKGALQDRIEALKLHAKESPPPESRIPSTFVATLRQLAKEIHAQSVWLNEVLDGASGIVSVEVTEVRPSRFEEEHHPFPGKMQPASQDKGMSLSAKKLLEVLAMRFPGALSGSEIGLLAGLKARGGSYNTAMKQLMDGCLIESPASRAYKATALGYEMAGKPEMVGLSPKQILESWKSKLPRTSFRIAEILMAQWPKGLTRSEVGRLLNIAPRGGSFNTAMAKLRAAGLIDDGGSSVTASALLMEFDDHVH